MSFVHLYLPPGIMCFRNNDENLLKHRTVIIPAELANDLNVLAWEFKIQKEI